MILHLQTTQTVHTFKCTINYHNSVLGQLAKIVVFVLLNFQILDSGQRLFCQLQSVTVAVKHNTCLIQRFRLTNSHGYRGIIAQESPRAARSSKGNYWERWSASHRIYWWYCQGKLNCSCGNFATYVNSTPFIDRFSQIVGNGNTKNCSINGWINKCRKIKARFGIILTAAQILRPFFVSVLFFHFRPKQKRYQKTNVCKRL